MVSDAFGHLLEELGKEIGITGLEPDSNNACVIKFPNKVVVQIEIDRTRTFLILATELGVIPPGKYRENVFKEALISNGQNPPRNGDFSFSPKKDLLVLMQYLSLNDLKGDKVAQELIPFIEKAKSWKEALLRGDVPMAKTIRTGASSGGGLFGIIKK